MFCVGVHANEQPLVVTPPEPCRHNVVVTGYSPPTNEMLRPFSANPEQNPNGWVGKNWEGTGYDVYAFFPEFPPDGDPTNDQIGDLGSVGSLESDFRVDYQDTSRDFWRIMESKQPRILITTSRGGDIAWELEAIEGNHGAPQDWISDRWGEQTHPIAGSVDQRTTTLLQSYGNAPLPSKLPLADILAHLVPLNRAEIAIDEGTSGNYLSGFMGLHGLYYQKITPGVLAAGHVHVGRDVSVQLAHELFVETLKVVLKAHPHGCRLRDTRPAHDGVQPSS